MSEISDERGEDSTTDYIIEDLQKRLTNLETQTKDHKQRIQRLEQLMKEAQIA